ncbi:MAG: A/G-specific adenine glycosylase [Rhodospirillaceae bacterium]|nr:A/G-specific adenine glycosylase [Rhodospirillaceae bacterium]
MPWRALPGKSPAPYAVWLSEIMLQQTTVAAVKPYFMKFMARWPTVADLAAAATDDVMAAWAGLGYYARARNLHRCAQMTVSQFAGRFPGTEQELLSLPGIGPYTAAAIAAIAFDQRCVVVDGNVERVMARLHAVSEPLPRAKKKLHALAASLTPQDRSGDYAQAVMDLGATICTPKSPNCAQCPWAKFCAARKQGIAADLPRKSPKQKTITRHGVVFWALDSKKRVLLVRRPPKGLLGGMLAFPTTLWRPKKWTPSEACKAQPLKSKWTPLPGVVSHTFTHFHLELEVWVGRAVSTAKASLADATWAAVESVVNLGLPNLMQKVARHVGVQARPQAKSRVRRA